MQNTTTTRAAAGPAPRTARPGLARLQSAGLLLIALCGLAWLGLNNPLEHSFLPRCPTEKYVGVYCPGCGATRATHHLLQGRLAQAMAYNPVLVVVGTPLFLWTLMTLGYHAATGRWFKRWQLPGYVGWTVLMAMLAFAVLRNLPGETFEMLRPTPVAVDRARALGEEAE